MEKLIIDGKKILSGNINISGSKNSALPILAATILNNHTIIKNIPPIINKNPSTISTIVPICWLESRIANMIGLNRSDVSETLLL